VYIAGKLVLRSLCCAVASQYRLTSRYRYSLLADTRLLCVLTRVDTIHHEQWSAPLHLLMTLHRMTFFQRSVTTRRDVPILSATGFALGLVALLNHGRLALSHVLACNIMYAMVYCQLPIERMVEQSSSCHLSCMHACCDAAAVRAVCRSYRSASPQGFGHA
jgi:hypothetical protein